jgi:radical SAM superfamily enzyme YgiQ (UPF0313 family)
MYKLEDKKMEKLDKKLMKYTGELTMLNNLYGKNLISKDEMLEIKRSIKNSYDINSVLRSIERIKQSSNTNKTGKEKSVLEALKVNKELIKENTGSVKKIAKSKNTQER